MKFLSDILAKAGLTVDGVVTLNNTATGQTPAANDNSTKLATTAWVRGFVTPYSLPIASGVTLGGIKIGSGLNIDGTGIVSVAATGVGAIRALQQITATAGQTVFTVSGGYTPGLIDVFLNGVLLTPTAITSTNGTTFTLGDGALVNDLLDIFVYNPIYNGFISTTDQVPEGATNLYYTNARARAAISLTTTGSSGAATYNSSTGVLNIPSYIGGVVSIFGRTGTVVAVSGDYTTTLVTEGTNLYYTDARARAAISVTGSGSYNSSTGVITVTGGVTSVNTLTGAVVLTTTNIAEGTNLYYTQARFDTAFGNKSTTNLAEGTNLYYTTARANADFDTRLATKSTTNLTEGSNLYYTDARVLSYLTTNLYATQSYVGTQIANLVASAPGTLDTLNELAVALGNDPNFATTVATSIGTKVPQTRTITINGTAYDLSADRSWTIASGVTSFNTRTGAITPTSGDYTTALVTESGNLYYTDARARAAISLTTTGTSGAATYTSGVLNIPQYQGVLTNPVTGTGTSGQVAYFNGTNSITSESNLFWDSTNDRLGIGTAIPANTLDVIRGTAGTMGRGVYESASFSFNGDMKFGLYTSAAAGLGGASLLFGATNFTAAGTYPGFELQFSPSATLASNYIRFNSVGRDATGTVVSATSNILCIFQSANVVVGSGTDSGYRFDVNGTTRVSGVLTLSSTISNGTYTYTLPSATGTLALTSALSSYVPTSRTLTINGTAYDLTADRTWTIGVSPSARTIQTYTATAAQTTFTVTGGYVVGLVDVFINGVRLTSADFTATNGTTVVLTAGTGVNNIVDVIKYTSAFTASSALRQVTYFTATAGQTSFTVSYTPGLVDVYYNGSKLAASEYTASNGTTIVLANAAVVNDALEVISYAYSVGAFTGLSTTRTLTINGITFDLSADRTWTLTTSNISEGSNLYYTDTRARAAISLTTTGSSGASTYTSGVINIPTYTLSGLGGQTELNGTGLVRMAGTTVSYDNATYATQSYVTTAVANLVNSAPSTLDTLNELATALGNDANFATTITTSIGTKQAQLNGTGFVKISGTTISYDNSTYLTTASATSTYLPLAGGIMSGNISYGVGNGVAWYLQPQAVGGGSSNGAVLRLKSHSGAGALSDRSGALAWIDGNNSRLDLFEWNSSLINAYVPINGTSAVFSSSVTATSLTISGSSNAIVTINSTYVNGGFLQMQKSGTNYGYVGCSASLLSGTTNDFAIISPSGTLELGGGNARGLIFSTSNAATFSSTLNVNSSLYVSSTATIAYNGLSGDFGTGYTTGLGVGYSSSVAKGINMGWNTTLDMGFIGTVHNGTGWKSLILCPIGGAVYIGATGGNTLYAGSATFNGNLNITGGLTVGTSTVDSNFPFYVSAPTTAGKYSLTNMGMGFNLSDSYAQLQLYGTAGAYIDFQVSASQDYSGRIIYTSASGFNINATTVFGSNVTASNMYATRYYVASGGNATDPMIRDSSNTSTGIYFPSANAMAITNGGTQSVLFQADGITKVSHLRISTLYSEFSINLSGAYTSGTYYKICDSSQLTTSGIYMIVAYVDTYAIGGGIYFCTFASVPFYWFAGSSNSVSIQTLPTMLGTGHHNLTPPTVRIRLSTGASSDGGKQFLEFDPNGNWSNVQGTSGATVTFYVKRIGS